MMSSFRKSAQVTTASIKSSSALKRSIMQLGLLALISVGGVVGTGCARPNEIGYTPAYTTKERGDQVARNWDYEGKQLQDDFDHIFLLRPASHLTIWNVQ